MNLPFDYRDVSNRLLSWYGKKGRDLPWRTTRDPYRIWLSEIMLQQTTVTAVIPYYERFLARFPTVETLASASLDEVISHWAGLGYYSRARNLHKAAAMIAGERQGVFPSTVGDLMALPGIGRSTAGAIVSIAFGQTAPILDGNVRRILVRLFAWTDDPRSRRAEKQLWKWAEDLTPDSSVHDYSQAIMDLGATVCTPRNPLCDSCPLSELCQAYGRGLAAELPVKRKKKVIPVRRQIAVILSADNKLLLGQRPAEGFLGGLWEFPTADCPDDMSPQEAASRLLADLQFNGKPVNLVDINHLYSHFKLELTVFSAEVDSVPRVAEGHRWQWVFDKDVGQLALHGAHKKILPALNLA